MSVRKKKILAFSAGGSPFAGLPKPGLWIRTAAGPSIGFGHLRRSIILGRILSDSLAPIFLHDAEDLWTIGSATAQGWRAIPFDSISFPTSGGNPAAVLVDTREERGLTSLIACARRNKVPVISIHDLGLNPLPSDVVVDGSLLPGQPEARRVHYSGTEYLVLDPVYANLHQKRRRIRKTIKKVVVSLGGGNTHRLFLRALRGLRLWGRELEVSGFRGYSEWGQERFSEIDWSPLHFRWISPEEPAELELSKADIAITAGGLSVFEALCAGTPVLALAHDGFQKRTISRVAGAGACVNLGLGNRMNPCSLPEILQILNSEPNRRQELSRLGRRVLDGRGAERVSSIIRRVASECVRKRLDS